MLKNSFSISPHCLWKYFRCLPFVLLYPSNSMTVSNKKNGPKDFASTWTLHVSTGDYTHYLLKIFMVTASGTGFSFQQIASVHASLFSTEFDDNYGDNREQLLQNSCDLEEADEVRFNIENLRSNHKITNKLAITLRAIVLSVRELTPMKVSSHIHGFEQGRLGSVVW